MNDRPPADYPSVLGLIQEANGCAAWRVCYPIEELRAQGYNVAWGFKGEPKTAGWIEHADIVLIHRMDWSPGDEDKAHAWLDVLHRNGKAMVLDLDDDVLSEGIIDRLHQIAHVADLGKSNEQLEVERQMRIFTAQQADGVTVSTETLAEVVRRYTDKPVLVVPNALDIQRFRAGMQSGTRVIPGVTIGWAGGNRPDRDAQVCAQAWGRIAKRYPDVTFVVAGHPIKALTDAVPENRLAVIPWIPVERYGWTFKQIDIGCCPLQDNPFNRAKSPIKAWELAAAGAAVVASPTVYGATIEHGVDGYLADDVDAWEWALAALIERPDLRAELARAQLERVNTHHLLEWNAENWPEAWAAIMDDFRARQRGEAVA